MALIHTIEEILPAGSVAAAIELLRASPPKMGESVVGIALIWMARRLRTPLLRR